MNPNMTDWFDKYLNNQMSDAELSEFYSALENNKQLKSDFENYQLLIQSFQDYHQKNDLENKFNEWYIEEQNIKPLQNRRLWWSVSYIAASVALLVTLSGIWFYETLKNETKKQSKEITYLKKELQNIQSQQKNIVRSFHQMQQKKYAPANSQSTGFLIAPKYILTTFHSVQAADSIFVENENIPRTQSQIVYTNPALDVALLYVPSFGIHTDAHLLSKSSSIGNSVFTLGYPTSQMVYNEGYISAINGYEEDTAFYQITLPLNPGNSGSPLFDIKGNIIGMIVSKNASMEGVAFALKSTMLYSLRDSLPSDSIKVVWNKAFKKYSLNRSDKQQIIQKYKPLVFKIYVYQKSI
ncbi:MAG: hypothetical protein KatS3mg027_0205 [Bacteroidia bacterium]|nr:MAG: hypothetical protein KatS3mg027_0205 [Bacteroidia bacterium]